MPHLGTRQYVRILGQWFYELVRWSHVRGQFRSLVTDRMWARRLKVASNLAGAPDLRERRAFRALRHLCDPVDAGHRVRGV